jgi:putative ABC transport system permease protein
MQAFIQDLVFGARLLRKQLGFTLIAIVTLPLGIGANTALFSVVNTVLLKPLPYPQAERLVRIWETNAEKGGAKEMTSLSNLRDWQRENRSLEDIAAWQRPDSITFTGQTPAIELKASVVTANFFALLGANAALGRIFDQQKGAPGERAWLCRVTVCGNANLAQIQASQGRKYNWKRLRFKSSA